jgi:hypothetical protein
MAAIPPEADQPQAEAWRDLESGISVGAHGAHFLDTGFHRYDDLGGLDLTCDP